MSMKLIILGLLMEEDAHPYEIRRKMTERKMNLYIKMQDGSLYYAIDQLHGEGCIDIVRVVRESNRPDRTVYHITEAGKQKFHQLMKEQFQYSPKMYHPINTVIAFSQFSDSEFIQKELIRCIKQQVEFSEQLLQAYVIFRDVMPLAKQYLSLAGHRYGLMQIEWLTELLQVASQGRLAEVGHPVDIDIEVELANLQKLLDNIKPYEI
ncbi:MAG: PadR family transcriptional regulator [Gorillibacterium sp.]|nr:PadR family transcriptional regulator [Gorillibacterium sp.]